MKNILFKSLLGVFFCAIFVSCEYEPIIFDPGQGFAQLQTQASATLSEASTTPIVTKVLLGAASNPNGVTVNFTVTSSDPSRYTVTPSGGSVTIPAGEFSADILIFAIDNDDIDGNLELVLELTSGGDVPVGIAGEGKFFNKRTITIVDNDCAFELDDFVGAYEVTMINEFGFLFAAGTSQRPATLALGSEPNTLVDSDFYFLTATGRAARAVTIKLDVDNLTATIEGIDFTFLDGSTANDATYAYGATPNQRYFTGGEPGQISTCNRSITINAFIKRQDGSVGQKMTLIYRRV